IFNFLKGTIHLFRKSQRSLVGKLTHEFRLVAADRRVTVLTMIRLLCSFCRLLLCTLHFLILLFFFSLITCLISYWVMVKKPSPVYSFG
uniref:Uncharacterized protein n=1 Tax=Pavo cristatus TaxID=9049 RepID=A0A8C9FVY2_PAVCR